LLGVANGVASLDGAGKLVANVDWSKISSGKPTTLSGYGITDAVNVSAVGAANGVSVLDSTGKVPLANIPSGLGTSITGPTSVYVGQAVNYIINSYSTFATYTITAVGGTFTRTDATITFTTTASAGGAASITINGAVHTLTVLALNVVSPTITSPVNASTGVSLVPTFTSSAFAYVGLTQTQDSVRWEISTSSGFGTTVQTYEGASNYTSWTPTSLSLNTTYYVRVKHHSALGGWSSWSSVISFSTIVSYGWVARLSGNNNDIFNAVACDTSGNIYTVGEENSTTTGNNYEALITKWDSSGNLTWQKKVNAGSNEEFRDIAIDNSNNIYAVGYEGSSNGTTNCYITKWDTSGNLTWQRRIGGTYGCSFNAVATDSSGNIYAVGTEYVSTNSVNNQAYITKWDSSGNLTWQRKIGGNGNNFFSSVACDNSGNIYAVGQETITSSPYDKAFITKWNASGNLTWQRRLDSSYSGCFEEISLDNTGNIYTCGYFYTIENANNAIVIKWDSSGNILWQRSISSLRDDRFNSLSCDTSGNIYAVGKEETTVALDSSKYITKWDASGNLTWQHSINGSSNDYFYDVVCDASGNVYAIGNENSTSGNSDYNAVIAKWPSDITGVSNGALTGSGLTLLSIGTPILPVTTTTITTTAGTLTVATTTLTAATTTLTTITDTLTRYFSTF
jgi:hypothetical protein